MKRQIYLDNAATTKIRPEAMAEYVRVSENLWGNPSSLHLLGSDAERVLTASKQTILYTIGAKDSEIVFTASGTEANNLAIMGRAFSKERYKRKAKIITTLGEHASVSEPLKQLERMGYKITTLSTKSGRIDMDELMRELTDDVILVSIMMVNNEVGSVMPIQQMAKITHKLCPDAIFHTDAVQAFGQMPINVDEYNIDMLSASGHKLNGPKGIGFLYIRTGLKLRSFVHGGQQERGRRAGTDRN